MSELIRGPMDEEWFQIIPAQIDRSIFQIHRRDIKQEKIRHLIVDALEMIDRNPRYYGKPFKTLRPARRLGKNSVISLIEQSHWNGDFLASWIEQSVEWAQRIQNGESWETLCNRRDTLNWYRMIMWKDGEVRLIGGSTKNEDYCTPTTITGSDDETMQEKLSNYAIPLVSRY